MIKQSSKNYILKILLTVFCISLFGLTGCQSTTESNNPQANVNNTNQPSNVKIRSAHSSWIEELFQTMVVNIGLERLGYQIEAPIEIQYPALYLSIANGDLDYSVVYYQPGHKGFFEKAGGTEKLEGVGSLVTNGFQGYQIDKKTSEQYNITNIQQLKDPKLAKLFDVDGNGKANLIGCNPGWACELIMDHQIEAFGLQDTVEQTSGEYTALLADSLARYQQGKSILFYAYNPHWIGATLKVGKDVVFLEAPFASFPESMTDIKEEDAIIDGKNYGLPKGDQRMVANKEFLAVNPVAKRWLELVEIPVEDMNAESLRIKNGENTSKDIRRHAEEWIKNNQEKFDGWLEEAKKQS